MLAKLLIFSNFAKLGTLAGIAAISGIFAHQMGPLPDAASTSAVAQWNGTALQNRDSSFQTSIDKCDETVADDPTVCGDVFATAGAAIPCTGCPSTLASATAAKLDDAEVDLQAAVDAGCRLFGKIVATGAPSVPFHAKENRPDEHRFVAAETLASPDELPTRPAAAAGNAIHQLGHGQPTRENGGQQPCVSALECCLDVSRESLAAYAAEPVAAVASGSKRIGSGTLQSDIPQQPAQICRLRNRKTDEPLATLKIGTKVDTSTLTAEERTLLAPLRRTTNDAAQLQPMVSVTQNEYSKAWIVEAHNVELAELVQQLANYYPHPILCAEDVRGTVSATISAYSIDEALHRLVTPFGYQLGRDGLALVVGTQLRTSGNEPAANVSLAAEPRTDNTEVDELPAVPAKAPVATVSLTQTFTTSQLEPADLEVAKAAELAIQAGNSEEAVQVIAEAIRRRPNSAFLFRLAGELFAFLSDFPRAAMALEHSIQLNKYDSVTSQVFSEVLARLGQHRRSEHYAQLSRDIQNGLVVAP